MVFQMKIRIRFKIGSVHVAAVSIMLAATIITLLIFTVSSLYSYVCVLRFAIGNIRKVSAEIIITNTSLKFNMLRANITNKGPSTIHDLSKLDVIVFYYVNLSNSLKPVTYILHFNEDNTANGTWYIYRIVVGDIVLNYTEHPYLRPGEQAEIIALLPEEPASGTEGLVIVSTPEGSRAEHIFET